MKHFPKKELGSAIGFLVLLAGLRVGSYYAMINRDISYSVVGGVVANRTVRPTYEFGGDVAVAIFSPWQTVDRWIRPGYWW
jgi:hypothetical protein